VQIVNVFFVTVYNVECKFTNSRAARRVLAESKKLVLSRHVLNFLNEGFDANGVSAPHWS
jgi:hypothetical protein